MAKFSLSSHLAYNRPIWKEKKEKFMQLTPNNCN